jgi:hypothetical protein
VIAHNVSTTVVTHGWCTRHNKTPICKLKEMITKRFTFSATPRLL